MPEFKFVDGLHESIWKVVCRGAQLVLTPTSACVHLVHGGQEVALSGQLTGETYWTLQFSLSPEGSVSNIEIRTRPRSGFLWSELHSGYVETPYQAGAWLRSYAIPRVTGLIPQPLPRLF